MQLQKIIDAMEQIAPLKYAETWDNVGLLVGDSQQEVTGAMLCIDYTAAVAQEAVAAKCNVIIAYHPPIFSPLKRITADNLIFTAIKQGTAIYSPHTALDSVRGGINDLLADKLDLQNRVPLRLLQVSDKYFKLVIFVPEEAIEKLSAALFSAGAGHIGNYSQCSFRTAGTGTFFGEEGTNPTVGERGQLEQAPEVRLETIVPQANLSAVITALYKNHPYEEPAFDLLPLTTVPNLIGQGRIGTLPSATSRKIIIDKIKQELALESVLVAGPMEGTITRVACLAGAGGEFLDDAITQGAQLYFTGELRHHDALKAAQAGMTVVCTLHSHSERLVLKSLQQQLAEKCSGLKVQIATTDREPFQML
jgi:dinuclear metal center YbgI/SA1388 family protein